MRRAVALMLLVLALAGLSGCTVADLWRTALWSVYSSYGDGEHTDRFSEFNDKYDEQTRLAEEYYRLHR